MKKYQVIERMVMKAIVCKRYGSPDVLEYTEVERPIPRDNEVLIKVHAATVNRTDNAYIKAIPFFSRLITGLFRPKHTIPGTEFAGEIESIGEHVSQFTVGERVFGFNDRTYGTQAQYMTMAEDGALTTMPEGLPYEQAAASCEGSFYAINFLNKVEIDREKKVLVNGATGAIGSATVQLLKHHGVDITAVCNTKNIELVRSLGANRVIDHMKEDFTQMEFPSEEEKFDYMFDTVGKSSFFKCRPLLVQGGVYISSDLGYLWQNMFLPLLTKIFWKQEVRFPIPRDCLGCITFVKGLIERGEFKAVIDRTFPLEKIVEAYRYVGTGQKTGNVVISVDHHEAGGNETDRDTDELVNDGGSL